MSLKAMAYLYPTQKEQTQASDPRYKLSSSLAGCAQGAKMAQEPDWAEQTACAKEQQTPSLSRELDELRGILTQVRVVLETFQGGLLGGSVQEKDPNLVDTDRTSSVLRLALYCKDIASGILGTAQSIHRSL